MIRVLSDASADILAELRDTVEAGRIPLVGDARWSPEQWAAVQGVARAASDGGLPAGAAWATLTSGSSGTPRIVLRTHNSWADSFDEVARLLDVADARDAVLLPAPPAASITLFSLAHALQGGPRPVLGMAAADLQDPNITSFHGTPQAFRRLLESGVPPRLRAAVIGGSYLDPALRAAAEAKGIRVTAYYGAAELSFVALDDGDGLRPFPGVEIEMREGELWVRSPLVALGYAGAAGPLRRADGWATVGDRAELVSTGAALAAGPETGADPLRIRLLGRADDAILSASATIIPEEVEAALRTIPGVRDAIVFGMPRERVGALVAAFIEVADPGPENLRASCAGLLAPSHRPRMWFAGELPRTASGKPARTQAIHRALTGEVPRYVI